jgi:NAD(P)H-dependent flavin oxidoreductase YrpB (nitropropane dioxygenase family)
MTMLGKHNLYQDSHGHLSLVKLAFHQERIYLQNSFVHEYLKSGSKPLAWPIQLLATNDIYAAAQQQNDAEYFPLLAGQGLRMLKKGQSAAEIIQEIMTEAKQTSSMLNQMLSQL